MSQVLAASAVTRGAVQLVAGAGCRSGWRRWRPHARIDATYALSPRAAREPDVPAVLADRPGRRGADVGRTEPPAFVTGWWPTWRTAVNC
jgi:hypothetical protein